MTKKNGKMKGPSHQKGGIPIEVEGGEYVIKKSSVIGNEAALDYINETGNLPTDKKEKKMPKVGDKEFAYTEQGIADAKAESAETGIPISDGATRNVTEYAGGGKTGYNAIGNPMYKEGGEVMDIPGEQVKWASKKEKKEGFKPSKKGKFFSKEKRAERKKDRKKKRESVTRKLAKAMLREKNKSAGVKTDEMKIPGGQVKAATNLEKQKTKREAIAKANKDAAKRAKKRRDDRRQKRKDRREARPKLSKPKKAGVKTPEMNIPGEQVKWGKKIK
tara:strand:- start:1664 stop:2488 length:825 start_codon:yes stop_codon:yes gene_type:complete